MFKVFKATILEKAFVPTEITWASSFAAIVPSSKRDSCGQLVNMFELMLVVPFLIPPVLPIVAFVMLGHDAKADEPMDVTVFGTSSVLSPEPVNDDVPMALSDTGNCIFSNDVVLRNAPVLIVTRLLGRLIVVS